MSDTIASPYTHVCDIGTIDYSGATEGFIYCRDCGRQWLFSSSGWVARPLVKRKPA